MSAADLANLLSKGGPYAVILLLVVAIGGLLRRVVHIPDDKYVPREMYEEKVKSEAEWKGAATTAVATVKEQADQIAKLTELLEVGMTTRTRR